MAEAVTIARPYAHAVFKIAHEKGELKTWSAWLAVLAQCAKDAQMQAVITNPAINDDEVVAALTEIAACADSQDAKSFLMLLAENNRLLLLAEIAELFEQLRAEAEQTMTASVISARELTSEQKAKISAALKNRLGRDVTLDVSVDETLLGGAIIRAGDLVIDGSAIGKLNRLASAIS